MVVIHPQEEIEALNERIEYLQKLLNAICVRWEVLAEQADVDYLTIDDGEAEYGMRMTERAMRDKSNANDYDVVEKTRYESRFTPAFHRDVWNHVLHVNLLKKAGK